MSHLIIIQNGLNSASHFLNSVRDTLKHYLDNNYIVVISDANNFHETWKGLNRCGQNLTDFVYECYQKHKPKYISFIGHSFGGLIIRNSIGRLEQNRFFEQVEPILYASVATPHLGSLSMNGIKKFFARNLIGQSGYELLLEDKSQILMKMSQKDTHYYNGLEKFKIILAYGNIQNDNMVSFESACITTSIKKHFPLNKLITINPIDDCEISNHQNKILSDLDQLPWKRKAINLSEYFRAHNVIINNGFTKQTAVLEDITSYLQNHYKQ